MQYLLLERVNKSYGEKVLFSDLNLSISKGDKIALVAKNGSGKTTLLRIIAGEDGVEGENAKILFAKDLRMAYLKQEPDFNPEDTVLDAIFDSDVEAIRIIKDYENALLHEDHEAMSILMARIEDLKAWDIEARVKEVLGKLKIHNLDKKVGELSGGQQKRLALAQILIDDPDFLILDEPTNHLDLEMIEWLENYLQRSQLTLFMVTHDRYFLERVCNEIIELDEGEIFIYSGNYSDFLEKREVRLQNEAVHLEKTKKLFKKELEWIRRQPKARGTKAKSRVDKFFDIKEKAHQKRSDDEVEFIIQSERLGSKICELHNVSKSFDELKIVDGFDYKFRKNEKLGIVGPNGAGKSTFLNIITGELKPDTGKVVIGETVKFGYYHQDGMRLKEDKRVIDVIRDIAEYIPLEKGQKITAASLLERFLFPRPQQQVYVSQLSGGEKRRLHLLTVLMQNPNFLILDEPTNDLDIITLNVLEDYLQSYKGVLIIVTHDRYFMDKLVDHLFVMKGQGIIKDYNGTYSEYRSKHTWTSINTPEIIEEKEVLPKKEEKPDKPKVSYSQKMEFQKLEKSLEAMEKRKAEINQLFLSGDLDNDQISDISKELGEINKSIVDAEDRWLELAELMS